MNEKVKEIIDEVIRTKSKIIEFKNCQLATIPDEVLEMDWLEELRIIETEKLNIKGASKITLPKNIKKLHKLKEFVFGNLNLLIPFKVKGLKNLKNIESITMITLVGIHLTGNEIEDISFLRELNNLSSLVLSGNTIEDISFLRELKNLTSLILRVSQIADISFLKDLKNLTSLDLLGNKIEDISFLRELQNLTSLDLSGNKIEDISFLRELKNLTSLYLRSNQIEDTSFLRELKNLISLDLSENKIEDASFLRNLKDLRKLSLSRCIIEDISFLKDLKSLTFLDLSRNKIEDISSLKYLKKVTSLDLSYNKIADLSPLIPLLQRGIKTYNTDEYIPEEHLNLYDNKWSSPPVHIIDGGTDAILNYFENLESQEKEYLYEAKLIIVGQGSVGKTSLRKKLCNRNNPLPIENATTKGIDIEHYKFTFEEEKSFTANIWDFGGQEIYKATHQFFLTKNSLYVLVDDTRDNDTTVYDVNFKNWLQTIELFGGGSPLLIFQNKKANRSKDIDLKSMQARFSFIKDKFADNLESPTKGLNDFEKAVQHHITSLSHIGEVLPKKWVTIRNALKVISKETPYITLQEYKELCYKHDFNDEKSILYLSQSLHNLGVFLHYQEHDILNKTLILQNKWATDAVYKVLDCEPIKTAKGFFTKEQVKEIWSDAVYADMRGELLLLMVKFELCYKIDSNEESYLIPQLLPESRPDNFEWDETENLQLKYQYEFMPKGLLSVFIVRNHNYIKDLEVCWKKGVVIEKDDTTAFIEDVYANNSIAIRVKGKHKRDLLTIIQASFDEINHKYEGVKVDKKIPCICDICKGLVIPHFYEHKKLVERYHLRKENEECDNPPYNKVKVYNLLYDFSDMEKMQKEKNHKRGGDIYNAETMVFENHSIMDSMVGSTIDSNKIQDSIVTTGNENTVSTNKEGDLKEERKVSLLQHWFVQRIAGTFILSLLMAVVTFWFTNFHPFSGFLIAFVLGVGGSLFIGNPERRYYRAGKIAFFGALGIAVLKIGFSLEWTQKIENGNFKLMIDTFNKLDWLFFTLLLVFSGYLFWLDYKKDIHKK